MKNANHLIYFLKRSEAIDERKKERKKKEKNQFNSVSKGLGN